jgi:hypothetical protein
MATTLQTTISTTVNAKITNDSTMAETVDITLSGSKSFASLDQSYSDGVGLHQANKTYRARRTLAAGANDDLDLAGSLIDPFGNTLTFTAIKALVVVVVDPTGSNKVKIGNAASNAWQGPLSAGATIEVPYQEIWQNKAAAGWPVTAGTGDILRINNPGGAAITYDILIMGNG